jgi:hypothetical protein
MLVQAIEAHVEIVATSLEDLGIDYAVRVVESTLAQPDGLSMAHFETLMTRLGDRAAIALIKIYGWHRIRTHKVSPRVVWVLETAFRAPHVISARSDCVPDLSILLLEMLIICPVEAELPRLHELLSRLRGLEVLTP